MADSNFKPFFQKLSDNIGAALYERLSSPFFQSFFAAWITLNWEIIYYLLSSDVKLNALGRIQYVRDNLASTSQILWKPLAWSFGFLLGYILLSSVGFFIWEVFQQFKRFLRGKVIGWRPADEEDMNNLKLKIKNLDTQNAELISQFGTERQELSTSIKEKDLSLERLELKIKDLEMSLTEVKSENENLIKRGSFKEKLIDENDENEKSKNAWFSDAELKAIKGILHRSISNRIIDIRSSVNSGKYLDAFKMSLDITNSPTNFHSSEEISTASNISEESLVDKGILVYAWTVESLIGSKSDVLSANNNLKKALSKERYASLFKKEIDIATPLSWAEVWFILSSTFKIQFDIEKLYDSI